MAFVVSRKDVGYFGYLCGTKLILFQSPFSKSCEFSSEASVLSIFVGKEVSTNDEELTKDDTQSAKQKEKFELNGAAISNCGTLIATSNDNKCLYLWRKCDDQWSLVSTRTIPRRCLEVLFTNSGSEVIAVDRGGDVYNFSVNKADQPGLLVLGHVCAILAVQLTDADDYIITSDRDGKIRISCYPNSYNIVAYCLGHREFVSCLDIFSGSEGLLFSGSGDGTLRLWKYQKGQEILCLDLTDDLNVHLKFSTEGAYSTSSAGDVMLSSRPCTSKLPKQTSAVNNVSNDQHTSKLPEQSSVVDNCARGPCTSELPAEQNSVSDMDDIQSDQQLEKSDAVGVKCIRYCSESQVFAVLFYTRSQIAIFQVILTACDKTLRFSQSLEFGSAPQDAYFDGSGHLWVLLSSKDSCVIVFKRSVSDGAIKFVELEDVGRKKVEKICSKISDNWNAFSASIDVSNLYKPSCSGTFGYGKLNYGMDDSPQSKCKKNKVE